MSAPRLLVCLPLLLCPLAPPAQAWTTRPGEVGFGHHHNPSLDLDRGALYRAGLDGHPAPPLRSGAWR